MDAWLLSRARRVGTEMKRREGHGGAAEGGAETGAHESGVAAPLLMLLACVAGLAYVSDEALVPATRGAARTLGLTRGTAAALLMGLATSSPEMFVSASGAFYTGAADVSVSSIVGSGLVAMTLVPALCAFWAPRGSLEIHDKAAFFRDVGFYVVSLALVTWFSFDGDFTARECALLVGVYGVYAGALVLWPEHRARAPSISPALRPTPASGAVAGMDSIPLNGASNIAVRRDYGTVLTDSENEDEETKSAHGHSHGGGGGDHAHAHAHAHAIPSRLSVSSSDADSDSDDEPDWAPSFFTFIFPPYRLSKAQVRTYWLPVFGVSVLYMAVLSEGAVSACVALANRLGLTQTFLGVVLLGMGTQIEDLVAYAAMARRRGGGSAALAGNLGSQVLGLCLGVGLPVLTAVLVTGTPIRVHAEADTLRAELVVLIATALFAALAVRGHLSRRIDAPILVVTYVAGVLALQLLVGFSAAASIPV